MPDLGVRDVWALFKRVEQCASLFLEKSLGSGLAVVVLPAIESIDPVSFGCPTQSIYVDVQFMGAQLEDEF